MKKQKSLRDMFKVKSLLVYVVRLDMQVDSGLIFLFG